MRDDCLLALSGYVNVVKERGERYEGTLREKASMENVVTRVERVLVEFVVVERRSLRRCVVEIEGKHFPQTNNITFLH